MGKSAFKPGNMLYPLPAVMVSCQYPGTSDPECSNPALSGRPNILTVAWAGTVQSANALHLRSSGRYSYHMIEAAGEFVVNLTTESLVRATDYCGVRSGRDVDKFKEMHLTPLASREVSVPGIAESPVNIECRVRQITPLGSHNLILADVVAVTIDDAYMDEAGKFHLNDTGLITYSHGEYFLLGKKLGTFGYSVRKDSPVKKGNGTSVRKETPVKRNSCKEIPAKRIFCKREQQKKKMKTDINKIR
ncbi:flavin reductase family protein [Clostridium fessum]|uniref:flavin reductase family protein n=1 Tax=Clostridium fessum TaxID=2126740 RepID=UPI0039996D3C